MDKGGDGVEESLESLESSLIGVERLGKSGLGERSEGGGETVGKRITGRYVVVAKDGKGILTGGWASLG